MGIEMLTANMTLAEEGGTVLEVGIYIHLDALGPFAQTLLWTGCARQQLDSR